MKQTIYKNAKFLSLDKKVPEIKAMLVTDGNITAMTEDFILTELAPDAEIRDLKGATLLPAFIEVHSHLIATARQLWAADTKSDTAEPTEEELMKALERTSKLLASYGITTVCESDAGQEEYQLLCDADQKGLLKTDVIVYLTLETAKELLPQQMPMDNPYRGHIRLAGCSLSLDGASGKKEYEDDYVLDCFKTCIRNHWQIAVQANTDDAIEQLIRCYRQALCDVNGTKTDEDGNEKPKIYEDLRPLALQCQVVTDNQLNRMQPLGIVPSFLIDPIYYQGDEYKLTLEEACAERLSPLRSAVKRGLAFSIHHDTPPSIPNMIFSMYTACNRLTSSGEVLGTEQTINSDQAVNAITIYAAYQIFEDLYKGSISPGKRADFVVLDKHPLESSDANLGAIKVLMTIKDDEIIYKQETDFLFEH